MPADRLLDVAADRLLDVAADPVPGRGGRPFSDMAAHRSVSMAADLLLGTAGVPVRGTAAIGPGGPSPGAAAEAVRLVTAARRDGLRRRPPRAALRGAGREVATESAGGGTENRDSPAYPPAHPSRSPPLFRTVRHGGHGNLVNQ